MNIDQYVGFRVRELRLERKMTESDLADRVGWTLEKLASCEAGIERTDAGKLIDVADAFGVPLSYFFPVKSIVDDEELSDRGPDLDARSKPS
jgi:transcriptional regulator with XRE-family HTH domain